jgi:hypothetical protein
MEFTLSEVMEREMKKYTLEVVKVAVKVLSKEYGFEYERGLEVLNVEEVRMKKEEKKEKKEEGPTIPLPFTGAIKAEWCKAIKQNHGLYSQCTNGKKEEGDLCKTCQNQEDKKGKTSFGYIEERMKCELMEYKDEKGKKVVNYATVLSKLNITRAAAEEEAKKYGITIPEAQFAVVEKTRGRPKTAKTPAVEGDADKKRGRPKKEKKMVSANAADDLIASLVAQAQQVKPKATVAEVEAEVDADAEVEAEEKAKQEQEKAKQEKAKQEQEKQAKLEQEKVDKKAQQEKEKQEKKAKQEQEKQEKKAQQEKDKKEKAEQAKAAKKAQQEEEKKAKETAKKAQQEEKKATKKVAAPVPEPVKSVELCAEEEEEEDSINVKNFEFEGKLYLRSDENVIYDAETQSPVGMWNEEEQCIDEIEMEED